MAQTAHQSPKSTEHMNGFSEANPPLDNQTEPTPAPVSPNNQQNNDSLQLFVTTNRLQTSSASRNQQQNGNEFEPDTKKPFYREHRGWLMIVAILAAGATYQAGLNPPGSFWQSDDKTDHIMAGDPILADKLSARYNIFFYSNGVSFLSSLVIIILLMNKHFHRKSVSIQVLKMMMVLDLFCFMASYAAGSCRNRTSSMIILFLLGAVFLYVFVFMLCYPNLRKFCRHARSQMTRVRPSCLVRPTDVDADNQV